MYPPPFYYYYPPYPFYSEQGGYYWSPYIQERNQYGYPYQSSEWQQGYVDGAWSNWNGSGNWRPYDEHLEIKDYGGQPFVTNIEKVTKRNRTFRTALWTGQHLQLTLMSIDVGEDIGLEVHPHVDQFLRIEEGQGLVQMGDSKDRLDFQARVEDDDVILVPAGKWHNVRNTGNRPLKLYSIYAPPEHPFGTVHSTKAEALQAE